jgi:hypothetical protein
MTVEPGQYVLAGVQQKNGNQSADVLAAVSNMSIVDTNPSNDPPPSPSGNAGEMFILTRPDYPGVSAQIASIPKLSGATNTSNLDFGSTSVQAGTQTMAIQLHGLTPGIAAGDPLKPFESVLFWQDQRNSPVKYTPGGNIDVTSGCHGGTVDINSPCTNTLSHPNSPQFSYGGGANTRVYGIYYQPRGAWMFLQGGGNSANANKTMIISGALKVAGSSMINFGPIANPPIERVLVLVE